MANNGTITLYDLISKDALEWGKSYEANLKSAIASNEKFVASIKELSSVEIQMKKVRSESDYTEIKKRELDANNQLTESVKEQNRIVTSILQTRAKLEQSHTKENLDLQREKADLTQVNKELKQQGILSSTLVGAYQKLNLQRTQAKQRLQDLIASGRSATQTQKAYDQELRIAQKEFDRLNAKVKQADIAGKDFTKNVGNYTSAFGKAGLAVQLFAGSFGIFTALAIGKEIFDTVRELDSLNKALKQVTETQESYNQAQEYLNNLAEFTGIEIQKLTSTYTKFYASAKNTNLTLEQTQSIFDAVSKSSAVLGLSLDDTEGALRAVEQMLSKGKVQAEEIRGQLGERLPGAFQILARSMGVSSAELNKMLDDGKVIAEEVLPNFAKELEKTFGTDKIDKVKTLNASIGRMKNEWTALISDIEGNKGALSSFFTLIINGATSALNGIRLLSKDIETMLSILGYGKSLSELAVEKTLEDYEKSYKIYVDGVVQSSEKINISIEKELDLREKTAKNSLYLAEKEKEAIMDKFNAGENLSKQDLQKVQNQNKIIQNAKEELSYIDRYKISLSNLIETKKDETNKDNENINRKKAENIEIEKRNILIEGSLAYYDKLISQLEKESKNLVVGSEEYKKIIELLEQYKKLKKEISNLPSIDVSPKDYKLVTRTLGDIENATADHNKKVAEMQKEADRELWKERIDIAKEAISAIQSLVNTLFQNKIDSIQAEMDANDDYYQHQMTLAEDDTVQQNLLEEERYRKQEELRKKQLAEKQKQAKYEKAFNIMQIGLNTASAIVEALPNIALSIIAGAIGAIQLATAIATPIPKYAKGTEHHKGGLAILGDSGKHEVVKEPNKTPYLSPNYDTLMNLPKGTQVYPDVEAFNRAAMLSSLSIQKEKARNISAEKHFDNALFKEMVEIQRREIEKGYKKAKIYFKADVNFDYQMFKSKNTQF